MVKVSIFNSLKQSNHDMDHGLLRIDRYIGGFKSDSGTRDLELPTIG